MNDKEYLEQIQEDATEIMMDENQAVEDRFAAMIVALATQTKQSNNI